jgi:hypothetical protein
MQLISFNNNDVAMLIVTIDLMTGAAKSTQTM